MNNNSYKSGDVVELKSGGPQMTIVEVFPIGKWSHPKGLIHCQWFDVESKLRNAPFTPEVLTLKER